MKSHIPEKIYLSSPVWVQNCLVSAYGYLEHKRRYGPHYKSMLAHLCESKYKTEAELESLVSKRLEYILSTAVKTVPFYQSLNIGTPTLSQFPILERAPISDAPEAFVNQTISPDDLIALYTGGSSANPLKVYVSRKVRQQSYAFWSNYYQQMDYQIGERKASFIGRKLQEPDDDRAPFWRYNIKDQQLLFSSYHTSNKNLSLYIEKLNNFKPKIIEGYPFTIFRVADYILNNEIKLKFKPKGISTSSENFSKKQREIIERAFNAQVFDQYGSAESVVFASECKFGRMHIEPEYGIVEILKNSGEIVPYGSGELIVTTLLNDAMPLIRYRIGDLGEVSKKACECGKKGKILTSLHGKIGAVIINGDKRVSAAAIAIAFEYLEGVKNAQIIQKSPKSAIVRLVKKPEFNPRTEEFMLWELRKMIGNNINIDIEYVSEIPPEENGKYALVKQEYYIC